MKYRMYLLDILLNIYTSDI